MVEKKWAQKQDEIERTIDKRIADTLKEKFPDVPKP
jgi:hypothetical protein